MSQQKPKTLIISAWGLLIGSITILVLGTSILIRGGKSKNQFTHAEGTITYLQKSFAEWPVRDKNKYRYLKIDNYPGVFEIFIGKDPGDFSPKFEKIDDLKPGDKINVYYDVERENDPRLNRSLEFIDKGQEPYFILGSSIDKIFGISAIVLGLILLPVVYWVHNKRVKI